MTGNSQRMSGRLSNHCTTSRMFVWTASMSATQQLARVCDIKSIEVFALGAWTSVTEPGLAAIPQLPNLRSVEFRSVRLPLTGTLTALANCTKLSTVSFTAAAPGLSEEGMNALGKLVQIKELAVDAAWVPTCTAGDFRHLSGLKNLHELTLENMVLPYDDGLAHLKGLNLKKLKLTECYVPDSDYQAALPGTKIERIGFYDDEVKRWKTSGLEKDLKNYAFSRGNKETEIEHLTPTIRFDTGPICLAVIMMTVFFWRTSPPRCRCPAINWILRATKNTSTRHLRTRRGRIRTCMSTFASRKNGRRRIPVRRRCSSMAAGMPMAIQLWTPSEADILPLVAW